MRRLLVLNVALLSLAFCASCQPQTRGYVNRNEAANAAKELAALSPGQRKALFADWKANNSKSYGSPAAEDAAFATWSAALDDAIQHNQRPDAAFFKGLDQFSDLTFAQFKAKYLMPDRNPAELAGRTAGAPAFGAPAASRKLMQTPPLTFDWRAKGKVPPPRNQGGCGSCWAFAAIGALEIKSEIDGVTASPDASEQQAVDCVSSQNGFFSQGCNGGWSDEVFSYANKWYAVSEAAYPYTATNGTCRQSSVSLTNALTVAPSPGYQVVSASASAIMQAVSTTGPVVVYFNVQNSFYGYSGGVYQAANCTADTYNHAMVVVGYNATAGVGSPDSYWIIRNSWGTWGQNGYINVQMLGDNVGACRMYSGLMLPLTTAYKGSAQPPSPPPKPSPSPAPKPACRGKKC